MIKMSIYMSMAQITWPWQIDLLNVTYTVDDRVWVQQNDNWVC